MTDYQKFLDTIKGEILKAQPYLSGSGDLTLHQIRQQALARALQVKPPTVKHPLWKYASLDSLFSTEVQMHHHRPKLAVKELLQEYFLKIDTAVTLVFMNGFFAPSLSKIPKHSKITIKHFNQMTNSNGILLEELLTHSQNGTDFFQQLNVAMTNDGALVIVPAQTHLKEPIAIYHFLTDFGDRHYWVSPQTHLYIEENAHAIIVEKTISLATGQSCLNAQDFLTLHKGAQCHFIRIDEGNRHSYSVSHTSITQHEDSALTMSAYTQGGLYQRVNVENNLQGKKANYTFNGLLLPTALSHHDWLTKLHHLTANTTSSHHVRSIVADNGHASYLGNLAVNQHAIQTNANMQNHHILLGANGKANSSPQLEILCDDVKCNHGSTTGELDENALFYLNSRGINKRLATTMLLRSHINYFIDDLPASLKPCIEKNLMAQIKRLMKEKANG